MRRHVTKSRLVMLGIAALLLAVPFPALAQDPPPLVPNPATLDVGTIARYSSFRGYITVRNTTDRTIFISSLSVTKTPGFSLSLDNGCQGEITAGRTCSVVIYGSVAGVGTYTADLRLGFDDPQSLILHVRAAVADLRPPVMLEGPYIHSMLRAWREPMHLVRLRWFWRGQDDDKVQGFTAQRRVGTGPWKTVVRPTGPVTDGQWMTHGITLPTGKPVTIRVRAHDPYGNHSDWASQRVTVTYRDIQDGRWLTGKWLTKDAAKTAYGGTVMSTQQLGATATVVAPARFIALVGRKGPNQGRMEAVDERGFLEIFYSGAPFKEDLQVIHSWLWSGVHRRTVTVTTAQIWQWPLVTLDAWVVAE